MALGQVDLRAREQCNNERAKALASSSLVALGVVTSLPDDDLRMPP